MSKFPLSQTACVLTFVTYILSTHPDVADKLRSEILSVVGPDATPTYDQLRNLKYCKHLDAFSKTKKKKKKINSRI